MPLTASLKRRRRRRGKAFSRRQWWYKPGLGMKWRKPRGRQSKQREQFKKAGPLPRAGYGSPAPQRGIIGGKRAVLVRTVADIRAIDPTQGQAALISSAVSIRKVEEIAKAADQLGIPILNPHRLAKASHRGFEIKQKKLAKEAAKAEAKKAQKPKEEEKKAEAKPAEPKPAEAKKPEAPKTAKPSPSPLAEPKKGE